MTDTPILEVRNLSHFFNEISKGLTGEFDVVILEPKERLLGHMNPFEQFENITELMDDAPEIIYQLREDEHQLHYSQPNYRIHRDQYGYLHAEGTTEVNLQALSFLLEYVAGCLGLNVGILSFNIDIQDLHAERTARVYEGGKVYPEPLMKSKEYSAPWAVDYTVWKDEPTAVGFINPFFRRVMTPMWCAAQEFKDQNYDTALEILAQMSESSDWRYFGEKWIKRCQKSS